MAKEPKAVTTSDVGLSDIANMTPAQLQEQFVALQRLLVQSKAIAGEMEKRNSGRIAELEFQIFTYRTLARPYQKLAKAAYDELRQLSPDRVKVSFGKGKISDKYQPFIGKFNRERETFEDARVIADPEDLGIESSE